MLYESNDLSQVTGGARIILLEVYIEVIMHGIIIKVKSMLLWFVFFSDLTIP